MPVFLTFANAERSVSPPALCRCIQNLGNAMKRIVTLLLLSLALVATGVSAQEERKYTEGAVMNVTSVRVLDGQFEAYMSYLAASYKPLQEAQKKAGIILDYGIYSTTPRTPKDPNLYLTVVYANMAALDGLDDKTEPVAQKVLGQNRAQGDKAFADRATMREILGSELIRELKVK